MKKESRFWKKGIKVLLAVGLLGSMLVPTNAIANEYVTPSNAKADAGTMDMTFIFYSTNDNGENEVIKSIEKKNVKKGSTYKELGIELPTVTYKNLKFLGWVDFYSNKAFDENTVLDSDHSYVQLYPKFEKMIVPVEYTYLDANNSVNEVKTISLLDHGSTYRDLIKESNKYIPDDINKEVKFTGWGTLYNIHLDLDKEIRINPGTVNLASEFENKTVIHLEYQYYNTEGRYVYPSKWIFIDEGTTYEEIPEKQISYPFPDSFKGLRVNGWKNVTNATGAVRNFDSAYLRPNYENCIVRFILDDRSHHVEEQISTRGAGAGPVDSEFETVYAFVAEKGETVTIPEIKGYTNIEWLDPKPEGDALIINKHTSFYGYGDKVDAPVVNPDDGDNDNNGTDVPDVTLPEEEIDNAVDEVKNAAKGEKVTVDMKDNVTLPVEVLESARGKDVEVVFNMGAYSWSINGLDITADTLKAINLEVKLDANAISADVVKTLAGDRPTMQLSLSHNGEFGFKAKLQFNLGAEHKGKYGNLYYYNKDGKLEFMNAGKIDENGNVSLEFTHASDYVVVIDEKSMAEDTKKTENPIQDTASTVGGNGLVGMLVLAALGGTFYLANKKVKAQAK